MTKINLFIALLFSTIVLISNNVAAQQISNAGGGAISPNASITNQNVAIGTTAPTAALHILGGSNAGMLPPNFKLDRNDGTNQAGLLTIGIFGK